VLSQAVALLKPAIELAAKEPPQPYRAPEPKPENWPKVRRYLTEVRRLSGQVVDKLHELGKVYADRYSNAVFVLAKGVGVELRGTGEKPFHGVRGEKAPFVVGDRSEKKVVFVESSIDALSLFDLGFKGLIVSMTGNSAQLAKEKAESYQERGFTVIAAFDNDRAGEKMVVNLGYPRERIYPEGKDWNEDLKAARATPAERLERQKEAKRDRSGPSLDL
jgi:5S rRNA maturation endonuclease (ribonuclease M5)